MCKEFPGKLPPEETRRDKNETELCWGKYQSCFYKGWQPDPSGPLRGYGRPLRTAHPKEGRLEN